MPFRLSLSVLLMAAALAGCAGRYTPTGEGWGGEPPPDGQAGTGSTARTLDRGMASWYGERHHGRRTANGETFDMNALTAAHKTLPFGTRVRVHNPATDQAVVVRINDRGPYAPGRVIDLSRAAAERIGLIRSGVAPVVVYAE